MKPNLGFALTGSFCTLQKSLSIMKELRKTYRIIPIVSERVATTDTRFFETKKLLAEIENICGQSPILSIPEAEPLGPKKMIDLLLICPCTGNTLSKMALGITDTTVTMAAKSHRRCGGKILIALSTNDALSGSAKSLGSMLDKKGIFFVPMHQDDPIGKPASLQCNFDLIPEALEKAAKGESLSPLFY
jgi:dipicolinate synthase subunit B